MTCPVKIKWGTEEITQCEKPVNHHEMEHIGPGLTEFPYQKIHWFVGDRREFIGDWPGDCTITAGCVLPLDHRGNCAT